MQVAATIREQIGGAKFEAMTGARNHLGTHRMLQFDLPRLAQGVNRVTITLEPDDTYTMRFYRVRGLDCELMRAALCNADQLAPSFSRNTGLVTSL